MALFLSDSERPPHTSALFRSQSHCNTDCKWDIAAKGHLLRRKEALVSAHLTIGQVSPLGLAEHVVGHHARACRSKTDLQAVRGDVAKDAVAERLPRA